MGQLILKRASASRLSGEWSDDDYHVLAEDTVVGRIMKAAASPVGTPRRARLQWRRSLRAGAGNRPLVRPLAPVLHGRASLVVVYRWTIRGAGRGQRSRAPGAVEQRGTVCYLFATQLGSTTRNSVDQAGRPTRKNLNKTALCETARHRTKQ